MLSSFFHVLAVATVLEWLTTLSLVFGGCCSNALTLELITSQYPPFGTLMTFAQFLFVSIAGLPKQIIVKPPRISNQEIYRRVTLLVQQCNGYPTIAVVDRGLPRDTVTKFLRDLSDSLKKTLDMKIIVSNFENHYGKGWSDKDEKQTGQNHESPSVSHIEIKNLSDPLMLQNGGQELETHDVLLVLQKHSEQEPLAPRLLKASCIVLDLQHENEGPRHFTLRHPKRSNFTWNPFRYRLKPSKIPLSSYLVQVIMFLLISLLNNAAFAYQIPMSVHIVFRSGGPVVNMIIGRMFRKKRYTTAQVVSIVVVTIGIFLTTLASMMSKPSKPRSISTQDAAGSLTSTDESLLTFALGIAILSAALILSGFLGLVQDDTYRRFGRGHWEESMFYLHAMALPMFSVVGSELRSQVRLANATPSITANIPNALHTLGLHSTFASANYSNLPPLPYLPLRLPSFAIPSVYIPLLANLLTQFVCVSGVNRLSSRVNSLTVTLVLAVRKAVSLAISVVLVGGSKGNLYLWIGALAVLLGTIGYAMGSVSNSKAKEE